MASYSSEDFLADAKIRYVKKLNACSLDICPYGLAEDWWINDPKKWPNLEWPEVYAYLVETPGIFTREAMKNRKSLEAHNQFISGWVKTVFYYQVPSSDVMIMKAEVTPSQRLNDEPHLPWVAITIKEENIIAAHCSCMAG